MSTLSATRDRRSNAGSRLSKLLDAEDEDDFYKTTYGGFEDEEGDNRYDSEASESDIVDSDFSIDEKDEIRSDENDEDAPKRKKRLVDTKAYKEPKKPTDKPMPKPKKEQPMKDKYSVQIYHSPSEKKTLRTSTSEKRKALQERESVREAKVRIMKEMAAKKNTGDIRRLTQEELLKEAKITEQLNLKSLENYRKLELEKKKARVQKSHHKQPVIRFQSVTMPLIEELPSEMEINVDEDTSPEGEMNRKPHLHSTEKCSRTFITYTEDKTFKEHFPQKKAKCAIKQYCPVTRLPAKYFDPVTQTPYANAKAFKIIREAYRQHIDGEKDKSRRSAKNAVAVGQLSQPTK